MKKFAVIGVGGYIAPRHIQAISDTKNELVVAHDPNDSVGILDRYFFDVEYFKEYEKFQEYMSENKVDYLSICTPNYLHHAHAALGMRAGADVICEKPLVLSVSDLDELQRIEEETGKKVYTVLQLRVHNTIQELKKKIDADKRTEKFDVDLSYFTSRGPWFHKSWKGEKKLSGGLPANIGIHFYDALTWIFGKKISSEVHIYDHKLCAGYLELERANVRWVLSVDRDLLPHAAQLANKFTYRSITLDGQEVEFSEGFTDLHTVVYNQILKGSGYGIEDARGSIEIVEELRTLEPTGVNERSHPLIKKL